MKKCIVFCTGQAVVEKTEAKCVRKKEAKY